MSSSLSLFVNVTILYSKDIWCNLRANMAIFKKISAINVDFLDTFDKIIMPGIRRSPLVPPRPSREGARHCTCRRPPASRRPPGRTSRCPSQNWDCLTAAGSWSRIQRHPFHWNLFSELMLTINKMVQV